MSNLTVQCCHVMTHSANCLETIGASLEVWVRQFSVDHWSEWQDVTSSPLSLAFVVRQLLGRMRTFSFLWGVLVFWRFYSHADFEGLHTLASCCYQQQRVCVHMFIFSTSSFFPQYFSFLTLHSRCGHRIPLPLFSEKEWTSAVFFFFNHIHKSLWASSRPPACQFQQCP